MMNKGPSRQEVCENIRTVEGGYSLSELSTLNTVLPPIAEEENEYALIPEHLTNWSDQEPFYAMLGGLIDLPHTPVVDVINVLPWYNYFINLGATLSTIVAEYGDLDGEVKEFLPTACGEDMRFRRGAIRPITPMMLFIVDTAPALPSIDIKIPDIQIPQLEIELPEIEPTIVNIDLDTIITQIAPFLKPPSIRIPTYSFNGGNCIKVKRDPNNNDGWIIEIDDDNDYSCLKDKVTGWVSAWLLGLGSGSGLQALTRSGGSLSWMSVQDC